MDLSGPLDLRLGYNRGIAFSYLTDLPVTVIVMFAFLVVVALVAAASGSAPLIPAGLVAGGALDNNLIDRTYNGSAVYMLHTSFWPTFNLADITICTGAALWVLQSSRSDSRIKESTAAQPEPIPTDSHS